MPRISAPLRTVVEYRTGQSQQKIMRAPQFVSTLVFTLSALPTSALYAQTKITPQSDSLFIAALANETPCSSLVLPFEAFAGAPAKADSCVIAAAAVRELKLGHGERVGVKTTDISNIRRISVNGVVVDLNLTSPDDEAWWGVIIELSGHKFLIDLRFNRLTREITVGRCGECKKLDSHRLPLLERPVTPAV